MNIAGKPDAHSSQYVAQPAPAPAPDANVGITQRGHTFTTQSAVPPDGCGGAAQPRARATLARRDSWNLFGFRWRLRGQRIARSAVRHAGGTVESLSMARSASDTGVTCKEPVPLRFVPLVAGGGCAPAWAPDAPAMQGATEGAAPRHDPRPGARASSWPHRLLSSMKHRIRYWTAPGEHRKALRMTYSRDKVIGSTYVFLNAILADEPLARHFAELQRQVRRLDKRVGMQAGISTDSAQVLREAADRTACARHQVKDKILSFPREELLHGALSLGDFRRADGILLALESRMVIGIALYGDALRCLAALDVDHDGLCETINGILDTVSAREAAAGAVQRQQWLDTTVGRLPYRTLGRLHTVLSRQQCGGVHQAFLDELLDIVEARTGIPPGTPGSHHHPTRDERGPTERQSP
ncbi:hypothetical protein [Bordetella bronchialis]|uniref:Uncharacterized protein n=1 Tax=Bordetella bronchialis TaxID=463025 RepID=A0A193FQN9_9BORD|nr:hypothetical protein [Bordetella bronchialis]ANN70067.1 hypothetical protein BAU08_00735 [Bordetella bronchialis]